MEIKSIHQILAVMAAAYPNFVLKPETVRIYERLLADLDPELLEAAALELTTKSKFFPTVAEIREAVKEITCRVDNVPTAEEAWAEVQRLIAAEGSYAEKLDFSHDLVKRTVEAVGGWYHLCVEANFEVGRAQFIKIYNSFVTRARNDVFLLPNTRRFIEKRSGKQLPASSMIIGLAKSKRVA